MSLRTRMLVFILLPVIILTSLLSFYAYQTAQGFLETEILRANAFTAQADSQKINEVLLKQEAAATSFAATIAGQPIDKARLVSLVKEVKKSNKDIANVLVALDDGTYIDSDAWTPPAGFDVRTRDWYKEIIGAPDVEYTSVYLSNSNNKLMSDVGCPIIVDGKKIGVVAINLVVSDLLKLTESMREGEIGYVFVVDESGNFISHPTYPSTEKMQEVANGALAGFFSQIKQDPTANTILEGEGKKRMYQAAAIGESGWILVTSFDYAALFTKVQDMAIVLTIAGILAILLSGGLILYTVLYITKSITKMITACQSLAEGDFRETEMQIDTQDEIGKLAEAMMTMRDKLRSLMKKVSASAEQVAAASEELTASASQSAEASNQVAIAITNVAQGADEQTTALGKTTEIVNGMGQMLEDLGKTAQRMADTATVTTNKAGAGAEAVNKAIVQMNSINSKMEQSSKVVGSLGARSQEIGQIVDTISGIAGQTNLLALNAAIEAARAGEQGRGFAVVAEEVRKLAEQSQAAAKHIAELISHIQSDTEEAVKAMQEGNEEVQLGSGVVNKTGEIFAEIETMIREVNTQVGLAHAAMLDIDAASANISQSVKGVDGISKSTTAEAQNVSAATQEQAASMEEMSTASAALANLAQDLQNEVNQFKV